jgi:hypothetical protein
LKGIKDIKELLGGKSLANKQKCFVERSRFNQKIYRFCQELKVLPRRDISFTKREKNSQEEI